MEGWRHRQAMSSTLSPHSAHVLQLQGSPTLQRCSRCRSTCSWRWPASLPGAEKRCWLPPTSGSVIQGQPGWYVHPQTADCMQYNLFSKPQHPAPAALACSLLAFLDLEFKAWPLIVFDGRLGATLHFL